MTPADVGAVLQGIGSALAGIAAVVAAWQARAAKRAADDAQGQSASTKEIVERVESTLTQKIEVLQSPTQNVYFNWPPGAGGPGMIAREASDPGSAEPQPGHPPALPPPASPEQDHES